MRKQAPIDEPLLADPASVLQSRAWKQHFGEQTDYYEQVLRWVDPFHKSYGQVEPDASYRKRGLIAYADGTNWNPGEGAGEYWYNGSAWKKIPRIGETATTPLDSSWIPASTGPFPPIWDKTITGSAVQSVTTAGEVTLDGNAHGGYDFEISFINGGASGSFYSLYINNDTTATNYHRQSIAATGAVVGAASGNDAIVMQDSLSVAGKQLIVGQINSSLSGDVYFSSRYKRRSDGSLISLELWKTATVSNLTRIDIVASVANGIGVNSRFRLWRRI